MVLGMERTGKHRMGQDRHGMVLGEEGKRMAGTRKERILERLGLDRKAAERIGMAWLMGK